MIMILAARSIRSLAIVPSFRLAGRCLPTTSSTKFKLHRTMCTESNMPYKSLIFEQAFIDGEFCPSSNGQQFPVFNPANGKLVGNVADCGVDDLSRAIKAAGRAFPAWSQTLAKERAQLLKRLFSMQLDNAEALAQLITAEMGKPLTESRGEIMYGASFLEWFAEECRRIHGAIMQSPWLDKQITYRKEAAGVVAIITPWNFPNAMVTRKLGAALAAGCTVVIKPPEDTPFSVLALAALAKKCGFPAGVINVVPTSRQNTVSIGSHICSSPDISVISFTGSTAVGKWLIEKSAQTVKRVCLELGGDAPFIVFESANIEKAVEGCMVSKFRNTGQTCVCANRIFVQESVHDKFVQALSERMSSQLVVGDGFNPKTTVGPLINEQAIDKVERHVKDALANGAKLIRGGKRIQFGDNNNKSFFYEPTLLTEANQNMLVAKEETFGPVAAIIPFKTEQQALQMANDCRRGLAGYFYSQDYAQIERVTRQLQVGMVGVNDGILSCCEAPFGGVKESGLGREAGSHFGVDEFINIKYVCQGGFH